MALRNCPECKSQISDTAISCPSCGYSCKSNFNKPLIFLAIALGMFGAVIGFTVGNPIFGTIGVVGILIGAVKLLPNG